VKIADFGISKRAIDDETDLRTQIGTQGYMAPEIFDLVDNSKEDSSYTSAVDLWSLGCLLYYLLTKETPFSVYELQTYARGHTEFPHNSLITRKVSFPGRSFIKSLLAPFPQDRPKASVGLMKDWAPEHRNTSSFTPHFTELGSKQNPQIHVAPDVTIDSQSTLLPEPIPLVEQQINEPMPKVEPEMVCTQHP
jgi:serine/threonine protein kinase